MEKYKAQGKCTNCGHADYPGWGEYIQGTELNTYSCPNCGCKTWVLDTRERITGKTGLGHSSNELPF